MIPKTEKYKYVRQNALEAIRNSRKFKHLVQYSGIQYGIYLGLRLACATL